MYILLQQDSLCFWILFLSQQIDRMKTFLEYFEDLSCNLVSLYHSIRSRTFPDYMEKLLKQLQVLLFFFFNLTQLFIKVEMKLNSSLNNVSDMNRIILACMFSSKNISTTIDF